MPLDISTLWPGVLAKLKGTLAIFRGVLQLHLERYALLADTNAELRFWDERARFLVDVLCVPWFLGPEEVERLRREGADGEVAKLARQRDRGRREKKRVEREERDRLRIEREYAREEALRNKLAAECREASLAVWKCPSERKFGRSSTNED
jgi:hypothetical protein